MWLQGDDSDGATDERDILISDVYGNKLLEAIEKICEMSINDIIDNKTHFWSWFEVKSPFDESIDIE
jgi:hypothetical protein